jgi:hypothetical protein
MLEGKRELIGLDIVCEAVGCNSKAKEGESYTHHEVHPEDTIPLQLDHGAGEQVESMLLDPPK